MAPDRTAAEVEQDWLRGVSGSVVRAGRVVHVEHVWGTAISITLTGTDGREESALTVIDRCASWFAEVDATFSTYVPSSEVSRVRGASEDRGPQSALFAEVMAACSRLRDETDGAFDPWSVPGGYDPSAYVKGWATGRASDLLLAAGFGDHLINAGGDVVARGDEDPGSGCGWPVGILNPHAPDEVIAVVALQDEAMATSGRYERGEHVIDPATGGTALSVDSATVVGPDLGEADALATAALVRGVGAAAWIAALGPAWSLHLVVGGVAYTYGVAFDSALGGTFR